MACHLFSAVFRPCLFINNSTKCTRHKIPDTDFLNFPVLHIGNPASCLKQHKKSRDLFCNPGYAVILIFSQLFDNQADLALLFGAGCGVPASQNKDSSSKKWRYVPLYRSSPIFRNVPRRARRERSCSNCRSAISSSKSALPVSSCTHRSLEKATRQHSSPSRNNTVTGTAGSSIRNCFFRARLFRKNWMVCFMTTRSNHHFLSLFCTDAADPAEIVQQIARFPG